MISATLRIADLSRAAATLTAFLMLGAATSAHADASTTASASVRVSYQDLNLATEQGSLALYERIVYAARKVCAPSDIRILTEVAAAGDCEAQAIARAVRDVNSPQLAATFAARQRHG